MLHLEQIFLKETNQERKISFKYEASKLVYVSWKVGNKFSYHNNIVQVKGKERREKGGQT